MTRLKGKKVDKPYCPSKRLQALMCTLVPNSLIFVSHQVLHLHTMRVGGYYHYGIFFTKELEKYNARKISTHYMPLSLLKLNIWGCPNVWVAKWVRFIYTNFQVS